MRNQSGVGTVRGPLTRLIDKWNRPTEMRRILVDALSCAMIAAGAVAFTIGLASGQAGVPGLALCATIGLSAGAVALMFNRKSKPGSAIAIQSGAMALSGLLATLFTGNPTPGVALVILALAHASALASTTYAMVGWVSVSAMAATSAVLIATGASVTLSSFAAMLTLIDLCAAAMFAPRAMPNSGSDHNSLAALLDSMSNGLVKLQRDGTLLHASAATENMFGCKAFSLAGHGLLERVHVLDRPAFLKAISDTSHDGSARRVELRMRRDPLPHQNGETRFVWTELAISSAPEESGVNFIYGLIRDISERKAQQLRLEEARTEAEKASSSKSLFLATMGHELRTPLNAIVGFADMMTAGIGGTLDDVHAEYATLIGQSGRHLLDVVNMLLDMSKINAGKFELHLEEFEPDSLVEPSIHMVSATARSRRVHLKTDISAALPILKADERACRQIIINLLSNAVKFSHPEGTVALSMRRQGAKLSITVSDSGIGMTAEQVARIGEPFFQAHSGLARQYEGTGLGLSIVKGLVDLHDGVMRAKSSPDEGTTVTVLLPLLGPESADEATPVTTLYPDSEAAEPNDVEPSGKQSIAS